MLRCDGSDGLAVDSPSTSFRTSDFGEAERIGDSYAAVVTVGVGVITDGVDDAGVDDAGVDDAGTGYSEAMSHGVHGPSWRTCPLNEAVAAFVELELFAKGSSDEGDFFVPDCFKSESPLAEAFSRNLS